MDAARRVGVHYTTVEYHARVLLAHGHVRLRRVAARVRAFPADGTGEAGRPVAADALHPTAARVIGTLARTGPLPQEALARAAGVPRSTLQWHLRGLVRLRVLRAWRDGAAIYYAPGPAFLPQPMTPDPVPPARPPVARGEDAVGLGG